MELFLDVSSLLYDPTSAKQWIDEQLKLAHDHGQDLVLSDEEFSGNIHTAGNGGYLAAAVADRLHAAAPQAHIVFFVRNQVSMIESVYRQYVKKGGTCSLANYLRATGSYRHRFPRFSFDHFEYDRLIRYYMTRFGTGRVHVFIYEQMRSNLESVLEQFCSRLEIEVFIPKGINSDYRANPSLSRLSLICARMTNRFYGTDPINHRVIIHIPGLYKRCLGVYRCLDRTWLARRLERRRLIDDGLRKGIEERFAASNQRLAELLGLDLQRFSYPMTRSVNASPLDFSDCVASAVTRA